jgi:hypothetical protein
MHRRIAWTVLSAAMAAATPALAETHDIGQVFRDFETICFSYAETGYGVDVAFLIEQAGYTFVKKTKDDSDIFFNADGVQLLVGSRTCAFGMEELPYAQMLEWTKAWMEMKGLSPASTSKTPKGGQYWQWAGMGFNVGLQDDKLPDGTPLTGLVLMRKQK